MSRLMSWLTDSLESDERGNSEGRLSVGERARKGVGASDGGLRSPA
jgi:hypothetical protein